MNSFLFSSHTLSLSIGLDDAFSAFRVLLTDSGYHFNDPLNVYLTRQTLYTHEGKHALHDVTLDDLIDSDPNEKKDRNEPYRKLYPWQIVTGRILKHSTGDESCFTPTIELCNSERSDKNQNIPLSLNLLVVADRKTSMAEIRRLLEEQLTQQLDVLENRLTKENDVSE